MIQIDNQLTPEALLPAVDRMWRLSGDKIKRIETSETLAGKTPVFTVEGRYQPQGWTEWTQGFQFGSAALQFDATRDEQFLDIARCNTVEKMAGHVTHVGVHDHGFNNLSTYGNLLRLMNEGVIPENAFERHFYELALKASGAVQAARWTPTREGGGFIYSFNGPQSLFVDTIRSCRIIAVAHALGHRLMGERDEAINLLGRVIQHAFNTADYNIFYGEGRDSYDTPDVRGRTVHETLWNTNNGDYRAPSTQQGYSPFSTWTRGLAWAMVGFAEELEFLKTLPDDQFSDFGDRQAVEGKFRAAAAATCDFYIDHTPTDGIPYWDTGAPGLCHMGDYPNRPAEPFNDHEPVDSSAAAIGCQGLIRLGRTLGEKRYEQAGLTTLRTLLEEPYLSTKPEHEGLLLHSIYHRPNGWDHVPAGRKVPCGEACMWGDYHLREAALYIQRLARNDPYYTFFGCVKRQER
jgi:hypothetical protein